MQSLSQPCQPKQQQLEEESCRFNCGFSALVNRRLSHLDGLFYGGEVEVARATVTRDPAQFKCGSLYAPCHSDEEDALIFKRPRPLDLARFAANIAEGSKAHTKSGTILCIFVLIYDVYFMWFFSENAAANEAEEADGSI